MTPRELALKALLKSLTKRQALSRVLVEWEGRLNQRDHAFAQQMAFGLCRFYYHLQAIERRLVRTRIKPRNLDIRLIILLGLYQLIYLRIPSHAAVSESVKLAEKRRKNWAKGLINGVLREFERHQENILAAVTKEPEAHYAHPQWLIDNLRRHWPQHDESIMASNNSHPPQILRVNRRRISRDDYVNWVNSRGINAYATKHSPAGVIMDPPQPSYDIPGYDEGYISIQDGAPQQAAYLMRLQPGQRVLDACAAPGGKTAHMLETEPDLREMVAIDQEKPRVDKIHQYLSRLGLNATIFKANALRPDLWFDGEQFDRILLDVPCTATGVIQRHPDIKLIRLEEEPAQMAEEQLLFLKTLWPLLKPGGILLYATCSLMPEENSEVVSRFMEQNQTVKEFPITAEWGLDQPVGRQILPNDEQDGFYYARLIKTESEQS